jgi:hypothetical protein
MENNSNPNWARWVFASLATYFTSVAQKCNIPVLVEGLDERTTEFMEATDRVEVRITGPFIRDLSVKYYECAVDANALFFSRYEEGKNKYDILAAVGAFQQAMDSPIPLYRLGNQDIDDGGIFGVLEPRKNRGESTRVLHLGQADLTNRIKSTLVDARYFTYLPDDAYPPT